MVVPSTIHYGGTLQLTASASDPGNDPLKAHVAWGDGQLGLVVVMPDGSLQAEHTYKGYGTFLVTLTLSDDEGLFVSDSRSVMVESPIQTIENLKTGTQADCKKYNFIDGECGSLLVKLDETKVSLINDRPSAPQKLNAYLNEFEAVVPNGIKAPDFLVATDVRDALILNGLVAPPD